jgi:putative transposase
VLKRIHGAFRYGYNSAIRAYGPIDYAKKPNLPSYKLLRDRIDYCGETWGRGLYNVIDSGMIRAKTAISNAIKFFKKSKKESIVNLMKRKAEYEYADIQHKHVSATAQIFLPGLFPKNDILRTSASCVGGQYYDGIDHDFVLVRSFDRYYIYVPVTDGTKPKVRTDKLDSIVALDPGVRTFAAYHSEKIAGSVGNQTRLVKLNRKLDRVVTCKRNTHNARKLKIAKRSELRLRAKVRNLVDEIHHKFANFLTREFETILIPKFNVQQMVGRENQTIGPQTRRSMLTWSHFRFRQFLIWKAKQRGCSVRIVRENYTSKTCTNCGWMNPKFREPKEFRCEHCQFACDRDINAARNIFVLNVTLH